MEEPTIPRRRNITICNVAFTKYEVVRHIAKKVFNWKLITDEEDEKWDILWTDSAVPPEKLSKMLPYQKINHFPGMYSISRKNYLAMNLTKLKKKFPNDYDFFPKSWIFPCDLTELKLFLQSKKGGCLIVKPEASCQGRGIFLTRKIENIDPMSRYVVQEYLSKPFLIDNLKFDLRVYVLITGSDPLRIFIHEDGLTRFATQEYCKPTMSNMEDMCMHLTNYAVNKNNANFIHNEDSEDDNSGHKRSLKSTYEYLEENGFNVEKIQKDIDDAIIKTLCSIQPNLAHHYKSCRPEDSANAMCFELLGFDIILDSKARPWVLEVNHTPSFTTDSPLDWKIKKKVIKDSLTLINISASEKKKYLKKQKTEILKRAVTGKLVKESREEKEFKAMEMRVKRDRWETKHLGGFRKVYPVEGSEKYNCFINAANEIYQDWTGATHARSKRNLKEKEKIAKMPEKKAPSAKVIKRSFIDKIEQDLLKDRCNSIPFLTSPVELERANHTVFERLSKPSIKKYKSSRAPIFPPIIYTEEAKSKINLPTARTTNKFIDSRTLYSHNGGFKQMVPKIFQFTFDC